MKHIKPIKLFDIPDPIQIIKKFRDVLDFPRQHDDGFLVKSGTVDYIYDIKGTPYEDGYKWIKEKPGILEIPEVKSLLDEWSIILVDVQGNGDVFVEYSPMTKKEWDLGNYDDTGMTYDEYLEEFE